MAHESLKSLAFSLLILNLAVYFTICAIAGSALNYGIDQTPDSGWEIPRPWRLFPMYFPMGNMATGFFVLYSLLAGVVGIATTVSGINDIIRWNVSSLLSATSSSIIAWFLTVLAMGLGIKEISIGDRNASLRTLEALTIIQSVTQLGCIGAIHSSTTSTIRTRSLSMGRV